MMHHYSGQNDHPANLLQVHHRNCPFSLLPTKTITLLKSRPTTLFRIFELRLFHGPNGICNMKNERSFTRQCLSNLTLTHSIVFSVIHQYLLKFLKNRIALHKISHVMRRTRTRTYIYGAENQRNLFTLQKSYIQNVRYAYCQHKTKQRFSTDGKT